MTEEGHSISHLSMDFGNINPNHKARLFGFFNPQNRWIANIAFAKGDDSIYLSPQVTTDVTVFSTQGDKAVFLARSFPDQDVHVSLHSSGVVNLRISGQTYRMRQPTITTSLEVITIGIKDPTGLRVALDDEVNNLPDRYTAVPIPGLFQLSPIFVSLFRVRPGDQWSMPLLSRTMQTSVGFNLEGKDVRYEIVSWQNPQIAEFQGDMAFSLGK